MREIWLHNERVMWRLSQGYFICTAAVKSHISRGMMVEAFAEWGNETAYRKCFFH